MHAYLIEGAGDKTEAINTLTLSLRVSPLQFNVSTISDVRELTSFLKLSVSQPTGIIIADFDNATKEAQSAFLKSLEEPQPNLVFILTCTKTANLLPTILSRCQHVKLKSENQESAAFAKEFLAKTVGERLAKVDEIKGRDEAVEFVEKLLWSLHTMLLTTKEHHSKIASAAQTSQTTLTRLKANGNVTIQLANLAVTV